jgi:hypothetical protein
MLTTARKGAVRLTERLSAKLLLAAVSMLTVGNGVLYGLIVMMGDCAGSGSGGCGG